MHISLVICDYELAALFQRDLWSLVEDSHALGDFCTRIDFAMEYMEIVLPSIVHKRIWMQNTASH